MKVSPKAVVLHANTLSENISNNSEGVTGVLRRFQQSFSYITTVAACCMRRDMRGNNLYQFLHLWFGAAGARTHDLPTTSLKQ